MISNYELYLNNLEDRLATYFENQSEYIKCKKGCSLCCEKGDYPFSQKEFDYAVKGYQKLLPELQVKIQSNIQSIKKEKMQRKGATTPFFYRCPFLIDGACSIYNFRGIICRTYGLIFSKKNNDRMEYLTPYCVNNGLNYSEVYDFEQKKISLKKFQVSGYLNEPLAYNLCLSDLLKEPAANDLNIFFGEEKPLIEWCEG